MTGGSLLYRFSYALNVSGRILLREAQLQPFRGRGTTILRNVHGLRAASLHSTSADPPTAPTAGVSSGVAGTRIERGAPKPTYTASADALLQYLADLLEGPEFSKHVESLEISDGVLEVSFSYGKGTIVINRHYVNEQMWYSAPNSPPDYFDFDTTPRWTSRRTGDTLSLRLFRDVTALTGISPPASEESCGSTAGAVSRTLLRDSSESAYEEPG